MSHRTGVDGGQNPIQAACRRLEEPATLAQARAGTTEDALALDGPRLVEFIKTRRVEGAGPSTAGNDLTWIGVVPRAAKNVDRKAVSPEIVDEARQTCRELRLIAKSRRRDRRPTEYMSSQTLPRRLLPPCLRAAN